MIRIGKIIKNDPNPLMNVSDGYEEVVIKLSNYNFQDSEKKLLACLIVSQTEKQYKKYMVHVLRNFNDRSHLIDDWQNSNFEINDEDFKHLLTKKEYSYLKDLDFEDHLEDYENNENPDIFNDGLLLEFYPTKKKGMVYWRRLTRELLEGYDKFSTFKKLLIHFITAQLLVSWESSCIHLGNLILDGKTREQIADEFIRVWPIYYIK